MPRVKIDYIVSFSNEDPEHPASNLLAWDVSKKKWLCSKGEPSCSVVLQLAKAVKISSVTIGAHQSALVEVLVGRSETPNDPFQVLVPSSVFQSPGEARRAGVGGADADKVRSFGADTLAAARLQRWDRLRLVCSQPYNKHCKFGLSFVHVFSEEGSPPAPAPAPASAVPARLATASLDTFSSDEEEFRPGELFAQHLQKPQTTADTGAQIRQATSQALKNIPDSTIKLTKSPLVKPSTSDKARSPRGNDGDSRRQRDSLLYTPDDDGPNDRVDRVINKHNEQKNKDKHKDDSSKHKNETNSRINKTDSNTNNHNKDDTRNDKTNKHRDSINKEDRQVDTSRNRDERQKPDKRLNNTQSKDEKKQGDGASTQDRNRGGPSNDKDNRPATGSRADDARKRTHSDKKQGNEPESQLMAGGVSSTPQHLLSDVVFVLSGYENPRRARLRTAALALGARCERDWGPKCTHLICAFPNTPKLRAVRSAPQGSRAVVVRGEWIEECARTRRRLPWQWHATEPGRLVRPPRDWDVGPHEDSECDTDDEIERVRQKMKKQRHASPPPPAVTPPTASPSAAVTPPPASRASCLSRDVSASSNNSDVLFVADERMQGSVTVVESDSEGSTDTDAASGGGGGEGQSPRVSREARLPDLFSGLTFSIQAAPERSRLIERYLRAYGGCVVQDTDSVVDYIICDSSAPTTEVNCGAVCVRAAWLWRCHAHRRLEPTHTYTLAST